MHCENCRHLQLEYCEGSYLCWCDENDMDLVEESGECESWKRDTREEEELRAYEKHVDMMIDREREKNL